MLRDIVPLISDLWHPEFRYRTCDFLPDATGLVRARYGKAERGGRKTERTRKKTDI